MKSVSSFQVHNIIFLDVQNLEIKWAILEKFL